MRNKNKKSNGRLDVTMKLCLVIRLDFYYDTNITINQQNTTSESPEILIQPQITLRGTFIYYRIAGTIFLFDFIQHKKRLRRIREKEKKKVFIERSFKQSRAVEMVI